MQEFGESLVIEKLVHFIDELHRKLRSEVHRIEIFFFKSPTNDAEMPATPDE